MARKPRGVRLAVRAVFNDPDFKAARRAAEALFPSVDVAGHNVRHSSWMTVHPRFRSPLPPISKPETDLDQAGNLFLFPWRLAKRRGGFKAWSGEHKPAAVTDANGKVIAKAKATPVSVPVFPLSTYAKASPKAEQATGAPKASQPKLPRVKRKPAPARLIKAKPSCSN